jgi:hypothetical protein
VATTLTDSSEIIRTSFPIMKWEEGEDGTVYVYGKATTPEVDTDEQVVDSAFSGKALQEWLESSPALRVQHNASSMPAGSGVKVEVNRDGDGAHWVKAAVDEPTAKIMVKKGHLRAYSIGIARPVVERDPSGKARGGIIKAGKIVEVSLVDSPANRSCFLEIAKADKTGNAEFTGKMFGDSDLLTKSEDTVTIDLQGTSMPENGVDDLAVKIGTHLTNPSLPASGVRIHAEKSADTVSVELPKDVSVSFSPADLAKLLQHRELAEKRQMDPNVGGGVDRDKIPSANFAGRDRSFPIVTPGDVSDAASSIGRAGSDNYSSEQLKENIIRIARRLGDSFEAELPESWKKDMTGKSEESVEEVDETIEKGKPFGGKPAKPFGGSENDDSDDDDDDSDSGDDSDDNATKGMKDCKECGTGYDADTNVRKCEKCGAKLPLATKNAESVADTEDGITKGDDMSCTGCGKEMGKGDKFCSGCGKKAMASEKSSKPTPDGGAVGTGAADIEPVPAHREPDGAAIESLEHDAGLPTTPDREVEMKASSRLKSIGAPGDMGAIHDLLCSAYHPEIAAKAHPTYSLSTIDTSIWQQKALDSAVSAPMDEARAAAQLWQHAVSLKSADPEIVADIGTTAYKSFQDANSGSGSFPSPTELSASRFRRPIITAGQARVSFGHDGSNTAHVPVSDLSASHFDRGPITAGQAEDSPSNKNSAVIEAAPIPPGMSRTYYRNAEREVARSAMAAMHDHIAQTFPDICPMDGPGMGGQSPTGERPVPLPVGASKSEETVQVAKSEKKLRKELEKAVWAGEITLDEARARLGETPLVIKSADEPVVTKTSGGISPDLVKSAVAEATEDLVKQLTELKAIVDAMGDLADPREAPFRGVAQNNITANKAISGIPEGVRTVAENAERAQLAMMDDMRHLWRTSPDPEQREAAWAQLSKMSGLPTLNK